MIVLLVLIIVNENDDVTENNRTGFTVYGDEIENFKYKTYHELIYDRMIETVTIKLVCKKISKIII